MPRATQGPEGHDAWGTSRRLDAAALTDHSRWASAFLGLAGAPGWTGIDGRAWRRGRPWRMRPTRRGSSVTGPPADYAPLGRAIAYPSPFWLTPAP